MLAQEKAQQAERQELLRLQQIETEAAERSARIQLQIAKERRENNQMLLAGPAGAASIAVCGGKGKRGSAKGAIPAPPPPVQNAFFMARPAASTGKGLSHNGGSNGNPSSCNGLVALDGNSSCGDLAAAAEFEVRIVLFVITCGLF